MNRGQPVLALLVVFLVLGLVAQVVPLYTDWLWFQEVGYTPVFLKTLSLRGSLMPTPGILSVAIAAAKARLDGVVVPEANAAEAALVDGATRWRAFTGIALRLAVPGIVTSALLAFVFSWNEFLLALFLTRSQVRTLPVALANLVGGHEIQWGEIGALTKHCGLGDLRLPGIHRHGGIEPRHGEMTAIEHSCDDVANPWRIESESLIDRADGGIKCLRIEA